MLGEISPHHEYFDSKSSTETPPSYNQLNYHDTIERFFNSNVNVISGPYPSDEENLHSSANSSDDPGKNNISRPELKCASSTNGSGNSGSAENLSSESNNQQSFGSSGDTSNTNSNNSTNNGGRRLKPPVLTESLIRRHNEDQEKLMVQKHREQKKEDKRAKSSLNEQKSKAANEQQQPSTSRDNLNKIANRLKRDASHVWDANNSYFKKSKYDDTANNGGTSKLNFLNSIPNLKLPSTGLENSMNAGIAKVNPSINVWPPTSTTMPPTTMNQQCFSTQNARSQAPITTRFSSYPQMFPVYYLPVPQPIDNIPTQDHVIKTNTLTQTTPYCFMPMSYMTPTIPPLLYPQMMRTPSSAPMIYRSYIMPETIASATTTTQLPTASSSCQMVNQPTAATTVASSFDVKRPNSRATSVKAEPGSTIAMSESSKKIFSPSGIVSSCVSNEGGCFFNSCLNKSSESSSNTDQRNTISPFESPKSQAAYQRSEESRGSRGFGIVRKEPPWIEGVKLSKELIYQYQIPPKSLSDVLKSDMDFLKQFKQPNLVNEQLGQLFFDLDLEGFGAKLVLGEAGSDNASDSSSDGSQSPCRMGAW